MRWSLPVLVGSIALFAVGAALTLLALDRDSLLIATAAIAVMTASMCLFVFSIWGGRRRVDWNRIDVEQRLWESGPLGRAWLRARRRLSNLWKI